jgi:hypothetical protein
VLLDVLSVPDASYIPTTDFRLSVSPSQLFYLAFLQVLAQQGPVRFVGVYFLGVAAGIGPVELIGAALLPFGIVAVGTF